MNSTLQVGSRQLPAQSENQNVSVKKIPEKLPLAVIAVNTSAFALAFAAWVVFGPSVRFIAKEMHLSLQIATLIKTLPILVGSTMRIPIGILADRIGARLVFPLLLLASGAGVYAASLAQSGTQLIVLSLVIGVCGATFIAGVKSVSSWTPKAQRGFALGIFGTGNVGTALTTFGFPLLLSSLGWRGSFRIYAMVLASAAAAYWLLIRNASRSGAVPVLAPRYLRSRPCAPGDSVCTTWPPSEYSSLLHSRLPTFISMAIVSRPKPPACWPPPSPLAPV